MSAGSRVHIYKFVEEEGEMVLQGDTFDQLKPGLSAYPEKPEDAAKSLEPLLALALKTVPAKLQVRDIGLHQSACNVNQSDVPRPSAAYAW